MSKPLSYATPDADQLPEVVPEVEAMIDRRAAPFAMRSYFLSDKDTVRYITKSLRRRKAVERVSRACEICGSSAGGMCVPMTWEVAMTRRTSKGREQRFSQAHVITHHAMCRACHARFASRFNLFRRIEWAANAAVLSFPFMLLVLLGVLFSGRRPWDWMFPLFMGLFPIMGIGCFVSPLANNRRRSDNLPFSMMRSLQLAKVHPPAYSEPNP